MNEQLTIILSLLGFFLFWIAIIRVMAKFGGWEELVESYPDMSSGSAEEKKTVQFLGMKKGINYKGIVSFGSTPQGVRVKVMTLFRFGHDPLFIPWSDIEVADSKFSDVDKKMLERSQSNPKATEFAQMMLEKRRNTTRSIVLQRNTDVRFVVNRAVAEWILEQKQKYNFS